MSSYVVTFKCHCRQEIDAQNKDRIVTEACGHSKCRNCFIKEESGCVKCLSSKTCVDQHGSSIDPKVKQLLQNNDMIQMTHTPLISKLDHVSSGTSSSNSKPKDIRVLEEVIIKPFIEIPSNGSNGFTFPRMKEFQKFKYPPHISRQTVNGKTEFECKICKKSFRSKSNRRYHFYCDETVEKPFNCSKCSKVFFIFILFNYNTMTMTNQSFIHRHSLRKAIWSTMKIVTTIFSIFATNAVVHF